MTMEINNNKSNGGLDKRVLPNVTVSEEVYIGGLVDITSFLCSELTQFLIEEDRYFGMVKSYMKSLNIAISIIERDVTEEDIDIFSKILFLYKPLILKEFNRLKSKSLTNGDAVIVLIKKILDIIFGHEYKHNKEVRTVRKIINKLFDNIKNKKKNDPLYYFANTIKIYMASGSIGKFNLDQITLVPVKVEKEELVGTGIRIDEESDSKIKEVSWIDE